MLTLIRENCRPENIKLTVQVIAEVINEDVTYQKTPLDLRNQRTYAVKVFFQVFRSQCFTLTLSHLSQASVDSSMSREPPLKKPPRTFTNLSQNTIVR